MSPPTATTPTPTGRTLSALAALALLATSGCRSPASHRAAADRAAAAALAAAQLAALGTNEAFTVERPSQTLRRRLIEAQALPVAHPASLGTAALAPPPHWPEPPPTNGPPAHTAYTNAPVTLDEALFAAAASNPDYQTRKELVFNAALALDLERNAFRTLASLGSEASQTHDRTGDDPVDGFASTTTAKAGRTLVNGVAFSAQLLFDVVALLSGDRVTARGIGADLSLSVPLLRGAGRQIAREGLTQAERDLLYAILEFAEYRRQFAVRTVETYLTTLLGDNEVVNARENYENLRASAQRARNLAQAGRLPEIQVDQASQDELRARNRWVAAQQQAEGRRDSLKGLLGIPPDARLDLDPAELNRLIADADTNLVARFPLPDEATALATALAHRRDLQATQGRVEDAQRQVVVAADALRAELTLLATASASDRRSLGSADQGDGELRPDRGRLEALLALDLPIERTEERIRYRRSLLALEQATRDYQQAEDGVKLDVRSGLRDLHEQREAIAIQAASAELARRRARSTNLFLEAGRAQIRDILEAQEALLTAQNGFAAAAVNYRLAQLRLQRDLGLLDVNNQGLWSAPPHAPQP